MSRPFVVIAEARAFVSHPVNALREFKPYHRGHRLGLPAVSRAKCGAQRVLPKNIFDVGEHQLLVLLLVMQSDGDNGLQLRQELLIGRLEQFGDKPVDV